MKNKKNKPKKETIMWIIIGLLITGFLGTLLYQTGIEDAKTEAKLLEKEKQLEKETWETRMMIEETERNGQQKILIGAGILFAGLGIFLHGIRIIGNDGC